MRKIIHVDMDAFYASVEQRDNPSLKGKPIAVGGSRDRGVVAAANYEARKYGVHSAMPSKIAISRCPDLIFVPPRFEVYKTVSLVVRSVFKEYTDLIEPLALDEAYLDVTSNKKSLPSATLIAQEIKKSIFERTSLTASAGISYNKFLAKLASDMDKPDGIYIIPPEDAQAFIEQLPIGQFHGIGKVTAEKMISLGIKTGTDLKRWKHENLRSRFGKVGTFYYNIVRGIDNRPVVPNRPRKSIGAENTFSNDISDLETLQAHLEHICKKVIERISKSKVSGKTITVKMKFHDFTQITRSHTSLQPFDSFNVIHEAAVNLLNTAHELDFKLRLLGVSISNFSDDDNQNLGEQLTLEF